MILQIILPVNFRSRVKIKTVGKTDFTLLAERFFLASPLACTLSFSGNVNKLAMRNTRDANNNVHAKGLAR